jgi:hypothetical protein
MGAPTGYIQTNENKKKNKKNKEQKQSGPRADNNPGGLSNTPPYMYNRKTHSDWCSRADVATENRWTVNMPSFNRVVEL